MQDLTALAVFLHRQCMNISAHPCTFQRKVSYLWTVKLINALSSTNKFCDYILAPSSNFKGLAAIYTSTRHFSITPCCLVSYAGCVIQDIFQFLTQTIETTNLLVYMSRKITNYKSFGISLFTESKVSHFDI